MSFLICLLVTYSANVVGGGVGVGNVFCALVVVVYPVAALLCCGVHVVLVDATVSKDNCFFRAVLYNALQVACIGCNKVVCYVVVVACGCTSWHGVAWLVSGSNVSVAQI